VDDLVQDVQRLGWEVDRLATSDHDGRLSIVSDAQCRLELLVKSGETLVSGPLHSYT
jgi:hypothetical protein